MSNIPRKRKRTDGVPVLAVGDRVACIDGSLPGIDPFTPLTVIGVNEDGTLELASGQLFQRVEPRSLVRPV